MLKKRTANEFVVIPSPSYNPTFGWMLTAIGIFAYHPTDNGTKPWTLAAFAMGTQNDAWGAGAKNLALPGDDTWRVETLLGYFDLTYDYYGAGDNSPPANHPIELRQQMAVGIVSVLRRTVDNLYLGPSATYRGIRTSSSASALNDLDLSQGILGVGAKGEYDTRNSQYFSTEGLLFEIKLEFDGANGSSYGPVTIDDLRYQRLEGEFNAYHALRQRTVQAARVANKFVSNTAPFYDMPFLGLGADLRGYSGQYRDQVLLAAQTELHQELPYRFGAAAFAGLGKVAPSYGALSDAELHPSLGGGLRYTLAQENHINMRLDAAWGDEGWTVYLAAGEAF